MKKWFLKKYLFSSVANDKIIIGGNNGYTSFNNTDELMQLIELLTTTGVLDSSNSATTELFIKLMQKGYLTTAKKSEKIPIIRTQLFMDMLNIDNEEYELILEKNILILGAGVGSVIALMFCQNGFKNITVVDYDTVDTSEIYKNCVYRVEHIGMKKTEALKKIIKENFLIDIKVFDINLTNEFELLNVMDNNIPSILISAIDPNPLFRFSINKILFEKRIIGLFVSYSYSYINLGPIIVPGKTACYESINDKYKEMSNGLYDLKKIIKLENTYFLHPSINFNINILASLCIKEVIYLLLNKLEFVLSYGGILRINTLDMTGDVTSIECKSDCEICKIP